MSDQDFFFEEDEQPKGSSASKSSGGKSAKAAAAAAPVQAVQGVTMTVAALIGVIALLAGVIVGILLPIGGSSVPAPAATTTSTGMGGMGSSGASAPQLSEEQLQGGELPAGHPDISAMSSGTAESGDDKK